LVNDALPKGKHIGKESLIFADSFFSSAWRLSLGFLKINLSLDCPWDLSKTRQVRAFFIPKC